LVAAGLKMYSRSASLVRRSDRQRLDLLLLLLLKGGSHG